MSFISSLTDSTEEQAKFVDEFQAKIRKKQRADNED
jgi:hypothetical protein